LHLEVFFPNSYYVPGLLLTNSCFDFALERSG